MENLLLSPINTDTLIEKIAQRTAELLINQTPQRQETEKEELLTRSEAMQFLKITTATLWRYEKKGKITSHGIGGKRYFKKSELEQSLIQKK
ncbi:helix-turn-helix domain-containing protein [Myroides odoratimimus]|uniref:helix-turn-helix domain-containing protein n=1 Tax=Myroides odoratimimus TaxID=76832 RepID=UPI001039D9E1|nr:helix-turn-helix domain-containing protein [Myroides odoratimimus]QBK77379.1 DNA-binding protein [Myroides odoratimimus]WHT72813.1 helix-turn-helix domain-containing protein [Myroides odoratimimus]WHU37397.1 helix-turn-helix domain-containing protein [Myroides odoratimimus]